MVPPEGTMAFFSSPVAVNVPNSGVHHLDTSKPSVVTSFSSLCLSEKVRGVSIPGF